ncbi:hypothetical protein DP73_03185 [Desulfosporosinus sp. HMP52]|uniref:helix-turn-helix domain-containing protein n=1 Tax=Desulfosporosinus sp. HMP52 TaxID=1487923 RepID=UPI00051FB0EE|nr:helix-turn-helix transcriptional regulator [Desulfosporosinus sp. HMP52]KGK91438.1 hypothetical protein DP73_03185 [Desulfosporosinus sp. HMP52]
MEDVNRGESTKLSPYIERRRYHGRASNTYYARSSNKVTSFPITLMGALLFAKDQVYIKAYFAKASSKRVVALSRIDRLCSLLNCNIEDILGHKKDAGD